MILVIDICKKYIEYDGRFGLNMYVDSCICSICEVKIIKFDLSFYIILVKCL